MLFEFLLGLGQNVSWTAKIVGIIFALITVISLVMYIMLEGAANKEERTTALRVFRYCFPAASVLLLVGSLPTVDNLWKIRVGLIKFHLAAPENIKAGVETIERIGHKLECYYIGCEADKKPEEKKSEENKEE